MKAFDPGLLLVVLLVLLAASPLFPPGLPSIADAPIHLFRTMEMVSVWADGVIYSRWAPNLAFGYGYPLFDFAPPLPYFIAGAFHVLGFSLENSIRLLSVLCLACYGLGMYLFTRNVLGTRAALLAAAAYLFTPFRFREILLYGGNYPQILAIGLFPWVLWAFEGVVADKRGRYVVAGALCYAALLLSHNFHAFIFTPLLVAFIVLTIAIQADGLSPGPIVAGGRGRLRRALRKPGPVLALLLGLALTAFFWAPALHDLQYTIAQGDYYLTRSDFRLRLLSLRDLVALPVPLDARADNPYVPFSLGVVVIALAVLGVLYLLIGLGRLQASTHPPPKRRQAVREVAYLVFFLLVLLATAFMMMRATARLWETLPFLPYAEFPWRLMGIANLCAAFLAGGSVRLWELSLGSGRKRALATQLMLAVSLLGLVLGVAVYFYPPRAFLRWGTPTLDDYIGYEVRTQNVGTTGLAEYLPRWAAQIPRTSPLVGQLREGVPIEKLNRDALPAGARATAVARDAVSDQYRLSSDTDFRASFFTFYFPGWRAFLDGQAVPIQATPPLGLMAVDVPAGQHELDLRFGETPFRLAMDMLSATALLGLAGWAVGRALRPRSTGYRGVPGSRASWPGFQRWPGSGYVRLGLLLAALLVAKIGYVDPHTTWFRRESAPDQVVGIQHPMHIQLEDNVLFLGYDLIGEEAVPAGNTLQVRLYWGATGPPSDDYRSFVHLDAPPDHMTLITSDNYHPGDPQAQNDVPSLGWRSDLYVRDEHRVLLPQDALPIAYAIQVGLYERQSGRRLSILPGQGSGQQGDAIYLQQVHVQPDQPLRPAAIPNRHRVRLGQNIQLLGHSVEMDALPAGRIQPGQTITLNLFWQASAPVPKDYTVFVHLLDAAGGVQAQHDGPPMQGRYPTNNWRPGQIIEDATPLTLPSDLPPGDYRLAAGMYELTTGQRLPVTDQGVRLPNDAILLDPVLQIAALNK
jgi:hypothetical protein